MQGNGETGIETALSYMLSSPQFVLRRGRSTPPMLPLGPPITSATSTLRPGWRFFIWSSIPDGELLRLLNKENFKIRSSSKTG